MTPTAATIARGNTTFGGAGNCDDRAGELQWMRNILRVVRRLSPRKPADSLSAWTGLSLRQCQYILAERSGMSAQALQALLISPHGFDFLEAIIDTGKPPEWFAEARYAYVTLQNQERIREARAQRNLSKHRT